MESTSGMRIRFWCAVTMTVALVMVTSCAATRERRHTPPPSGFLGDYSQLRKVEGYETHKVYVAPGVDWSKYHAIHLDAVTIWVTGKSERKLTEEERQLLTDILYTALHDQLGKRFLMADRSGPGTIEIRAALTEAQGANVPLNVVTTVVPQLRLLTTLGGIATDTAAVVGAATIEIEARDSITNERLAAAVDSRAGNKSIMRAFSKWDDVKAAAEFWAARVSDFMARHGVRQRVAAAAG